MEFVVYDSTGKVLRSGTCSRAAFALQAGPDEHVMHGRANDRLEKIDVSGDEPAIVAKTNEELEAESQTLQEASTEVKILTTAEYENLLARLADFETRVGEAETEISQSEAQQ